MEEKKNIESAEKIDLISFELKQQLKNALHELKQEEEIIKTLNEEEAKKKDIEKRMIDLELSFFVVFIFMVIFILALISSKQ